MVDPFTFRSSAQIQPRLIVAVTLFVDGICEMNLNLMDSDHLIEEQFCISKTITAIGIYWHSC